jgi:hypothetical protein
MTRPPVEKGERAGRVPRLRRDRTNQPAEQVEEEAQWLAGVLLITEEAAVAVARDNISISVAATGYGVSEQRCSTSST